MKNRMMKTSEVRRTIIDVNGNKHVLRNVTMVDFGGNWLRVLSDEGYVVINPDNVVLMYIELPVDGTPKR